MIPSHQNNSMRLALVVSLLMFSLCADAQFMFEFPHGMSVQRSQEKYTPPAYKGGEKALEKTILKKFRKPAVHEDVSGKIVLAVIVGANGKPAEVYVVRRISEALDAEAVNVCKHLKFMPAKHGKKNVRGRIDITIPIKHGRVSYFNLPTVDL